MNKQRCLAEFEEKEGVWKEIFGCDVQPGVKELVDEDQRFKLVHREIEGLEEGEEEGKGRGERRGGYIGGQNCWSAGGPKVDVGQLEPCVQRCNSESMMPLMPTHSRSYFYPLQCWLGQVK